MHLKIKIILLAFLFSTNALYAQTPNHIDDELPPISYIYKPGKIITIKDTIPCFILDRDIDYYNKGYIKYKLSPEASKALKVKSKDVMHLELDGCPPLDRFPYGTSSYLMVRLIDGEVKIYKVQIESMDYTTATAYNGMPIYTKDKSYKRFLVRGNMFYEIDRINKYQAKRIFFDNVELNNEIENLTDQQILQNIELFVQRYNSSVKPSTNESKQ
ncbi:hypothetical protein MYP_4208 [Sporocytophaga myxococcoides]|uniref:DUF4468 domain-containing protein n=1 Tax=Sporocytophaga myxococcoides TaxID=153721 RepID=A0A098LLG7_9BACT|nr:hypothetical protein [Sporocytophaga myxococcoides]GAL86978.1 hypothetical protein MYP_4208 [Sporocytophaga myxococcoides]